MKYVQILRRHLQIAVTIPVVGFMPDIVYGATAKALTAGLIDLVLVMLIAFRWGFVEAGVASLLAVACLDYFYVFPIFHFTRATLKIGSRP